MEFAYGWCDGGLRSYDLSSSANVSGSSGFLWLLALRPAQWSQVWFDGNIPSRFIKQVEAAWGSSLAFSGRQSQASIDFVACSFVDAQSLRLVDYPRVTFLLDVPRSVPINKSHSQLIAVKHSAVGGVTTHVGKFLLYKCPTVILKPTVHRSVGSVIEHKRYLPSHDHSDGAIETNALLPIANITSAVRLPSRFTPSGFATRALAASELCTAFDFPSWSIPKDKPIHPVFVRGVRPLKTLITVSDFLLEFIAVRGSRVGSTLLTDLPDSTSDPRGAWISHYDKGVGWLPLSWIDSTLVTDKAVKTDKASVPVHLWDQRVSLPLEIDASTVLPIIRRFINKCT